MSSIVTLGIDLAKAVSAILSTTMISSRLLKVAAGGTVSPLDALHAR